MLLPIIVGALVLGGAAEVVRRRRARAIEGADPDTNATRTLDRGVAPADIDQRDPSPARQDLAPANVDQRDPSPARQDLAHAPDQGGVRATSTSATPQPTIEVALVDLHTRDPVIYRRSLDGGTSWALDPPPGGFSILATLERALAARRKTLTLHDPRGSPVAVTIQRKGRRLIVETSATRICVSSARAEVIVAAQAIETEGIVAWYLRALPLAVWWLLGEDLTSALCPACAVHQSNGCDRCDRGRRPWASWRELADELARHGVEQHRIEQAADCGGLPLVPGIEDAFISDGLTVRPFVPRPGCRSGYEIGKRTNPETLALYDKPWQMRAKGQAREALLEAMAAAGWRPGMVWTRVEARSQGQGLILVQDGEVVVDGRHPGAALDERVRGALWRRVLGRIWLSDTRSQMARERDRPVSPLWQRLRDAAEPVLDDDSQTSMISRAAQRQLVSVRQCARERLGRAAIDVGVLAGGQSLDEVADLARVELEAQLVPALARERLLASRARYQALLDAVAEQTTGEP